MLEAAAGLPTVAASAGGGAELVRDGETGLLVQSEPAAFASAIAKLAVSPERRAQLGVAARELAHGRSWERFFDELRRAYDEAVAVVKPAATARVAAHA